jgi:putative transposase
MKLNKRKIHWIIREKKKGVTTNQIARDMKISTRRVQQVWKQYLDTGIEPVIGEDIGRPKKPYGLKEAQIVALAYARYRFGARMHEVAIRKVHKTCISHNRIHMYLKASGLAQAWLRMIQTRRSDANGFDMNESTAYPPAISIGMSGTELASRFASFWTMPHE